MLLLSMRNTFSTFESLTAAPGLTPNPIPLPMMTTSLPSSSKAETILLLITFSITMSDLPTGQKKPNLINTLLLLIKFGFACLTVTIHFVFNSYSNYIKIAQKSQSFVLFFIHIFYFLFIFVKLSRNGRKCSLTHCRRDPGRGNLIMPHPGSKTILSRYL